MDIDPGDRKSECGGLMQPVSLEPDGVEYRILHRCTKCGLEKRNKLQKGDVFDPEQVLNA